MTLPDRGIQLIAHSVTNKQYGDSQRGSTDRGWVEVRKQGENWNICNSVVKNNNNKKHKTMGALEMDLIRFCL